MRLLTPWPGSNLPWEKDSFSCYHSSSRTFVEQVFGQIVGRWGILWRSVCFSVSVAALILRVCVRLHNYLRDRSSPTSDALLSEDGAGGTGDVIMQDQCDLDEQLRRRRRDREPCSLRVALTRRLKQLQCRCPSYLVPALIHVNYFLCTLGVNQEHGRIKKHDTHTSSWGRGHESQGHHLTPFNPTAAYIGPSPPPSTHTATASTHTAASHPPLTRKQTSAHSPPWWPVKRHWAPRRVPQRHLAAAR